ncbi:hypothetical protein CYMTET_46522 [Cymbomonas tetramitiformis]|uniref:Uncharacterized protein n=1 Tax=Cymbomonas tetramitiformis TaxID=36881 RepID=A0AAE0EYL1_9CHLO|nr:hypothetical protein CYMTET_46522 [Cymbomonas tetramitiformis]
MQPGQGPYHIPTTFTFPPTTIGPAVAAPIGHPSPLPLQAYPTDPRLGPLSPYPQTFAGAAQSFQTPAAAPGPAPVSPWTWSGNFPFREVPTPYLPAVHHYSGGPVQAGASTAAPRSSEDAARWLAFRRQEKAAILAASGEQHLLTMTVGAGGVPAGHPGTRYPAGVGSVGTGGVQAGGPFGAGYSASVPVIIGPVAQQHVGAGHAGYRTWVGGSVEVPGGAGATHPGLAAGAAVAGAEGTHTGHATGAAATSDAAEVATSCTPTPLEYADEDEGVADEDEVFVDEDEYRDYDEYLRSGGYNDVDPNDPYGLGPQWDDEDDEEEDNRLPIPRTFKEIEQEELVVVVDTTTSAQRIVTSSTSLLTHPASTDEASTVMSQPEVYVRPAERRRSRRSSGPASWGGLNLPFREESDSPSLGSSSTSQASSSSSSRSSKSSKSGRSKQSGDLSDRARRHRDSKERKRRLRRRERDEGQMLTPAALAATFRECLREFHGQEGDKQPAPDSAPRPETAPLAKTTSVGSPAGVTSVAGGVAAEHPGADPPTGRRAGANSEEAALQQKAGTGGAAREHEAVGSRQLARLWRQSLETVVVLGSGEGAPADHTPGASSSAPNTTVDVRRVSCREARETPGEPDGPPAAGGPPAGLSLASTSSSHDPALPAPDNGEREPPGPPANAPGPTACVASSSGWWAAAATSS